MKVYEFIERAVDDWFDVAIFDYTKGEVVFRGSVDSIPVLLGAQTLISWQILDKYNVWINIESES